MSNELKHSVAYLGEEYDDGLKHWRYKSKYKNRKGKWVYVYDTNSKVKNAVKGFIDTKITGKAYLQDINNAAERWNTNSNLLKKHNKDLENSTKKDNLTTETNIKVLNGAKKDIVQDYFTGQINYSTKSLAGIAESLIDAGKSFIDELLGNR